jgi:hypothetical protein
MRRQDWIKRLEQETNGQPLISKRKLRFLGRGDVFINRLVDGLDRYPGGPKGSSSYALEDVAERIMQERV